MKGEFDGITNTARQPRLRLARNALAGIAAAALLAAFLALVGRQYVPPFRPQLELSGDSEAACRQIAESITEAGIDADLAALCGTSSRMIGSPGYERAAEYIRKRFENAGLQDVTVLRFPVAVPATRHARLEVLNGGAVSEELEIYPFWPNLVRTCTVPPGGLSGPLIDAGSGDLRSFNGQPVESAIVLLDADCDRRWLNVPLLGGAAVIFCGSEKLTREQAEQKSLTTPVNVPRFFVHDAAARRLRSLAAGGSARVRILSRVDFENAQAATICGVLPGSDPAVSREALVLSSYFDSISEVPDLAEGGEAACGIAGLLQAADTLAAARPRRTVIFVANGAHFQGQGFARFLEILGPRTSFQDNAIGFANRLEEYDNRLAAMRAKLPLCRLEREMIEADDAPSAAWKGIAGELRKQLVRDIQMSVKAVLDESYEGARESDAAGMPRARRLLLQRMCWESNLESFVTKFRHETSLVMDRLRKRVERRLADTSAEVERLQGERDFLASISKLNAKLFLGLDLSSGTCSFGIFERGNPAAPPYEGRGPVQPLAERLAVFAEGLRGIVQGRQESALPPFVSGFKSIGYISARSALIAMMKFDAEACYGSNWTGATFCTLMDSRRYVGTPGDVRSAVNSANLASQMKLMAPMLKILLDDPAPLAGESDLHDHSGTATLRAMTVPRGGAIVPDHPVEHAIIVERATDQVRGAWYINIKPYACGVREDNIAIAGEHGSAVFPTVWHAVFTQPPRPFEAYRLDSQTGEITHALDRGVSGVERFPNAIILDRRHKEGTLVMFRCQPMALFGLLDHRYMSLLRRLDVLGADEDSPPLQFGYNLPTQPAGGHETETFGESCAVVYVEPGKRFKVTMSAGMMGLRLALLNMPAVEGLDAEALRLMESASGDGFAPAADARLPLTPWLVARDMWRLDEIRIRSLSSRGIRNELLEQLHDEAATWKKAAEEALDRRDYSTAIAAAMEAWAYESRAYPLVRSAADDAIKGVIFYLFLLLPFSFFAERLLFGFPKIVHRIFGTSGVFVAVFIVLRYTHPAFKLAASPVMVLLAFVTLALSLLVICLLGGKVAEQLRRMRQHEEARTIDINRLSTLRAAFMLGLSNLRKRPVRSGLTAATLVLMSFTVVSFTSVKFVPRYNKIDANQPALYNGILAKRPQWAPLDPDAYAALDALYGERFAVVPRGWYAGTLRLSIPGRRPPEISTGTETPKAADAGKPAEPEREWPVVKSLTGLHVREKDVTRVHELITAGRWFSKSDADECIVPSDVAEKLEMDSDDVGKASLLVRDRLLSVVGIIDSKRLLELIDLNGEPITPIDYTIVQTTAKDKQETASDRYRHFLPEDTLLVPYGVAKSFGRSVAGSFSLASVAVAMDAKGAEAQEETIRRFMASKAVNLFVGIEGRSYFYNVPGMLSFTGLKNVAMPLAIAFLIVLNTMLGAVYERFKDIYIFSSIGLAPSHIGTLFLAESCVFATIGGVIGYLIGQVFSVLCAQTGWLGGLTLNYSSSSVVTAMLVVMGVVIASSLYPAHKASRLASPSVDRKWRLPSATDDVMQFELPFLVETRNVDGLMAFIGQYLRAHREAGVGRFMTEKVGVARLPDARRLKAHVWMSPYDLGVSQTVTLETGTPDAADVCPLKLELTRVTGEPRSWRKTSFIFLDALRKQFLRWRTVDETGKQRYAAELDSFDEARQ